ncbi:ATP-binding protein [Streptomyces sp. NPDC059816]|uniref:ATP-binding protein n=1 Tax=Streptomyces sp. NPDC059816 TaxID=3346960 RepID=UPI0036666E64
MVTTADLYVCDPDPVAAMSALDSLSRAAADRGCTVRAAVADVTGRDTTPTDRPGWSRLSSAAGPSDVLLVRSRAELGHTAARRAPVAAALKGNGVTVTAVEPLPWETADWVRAWGRPDRPGPGAGGTPPVGGCCCVAFPALEAHTSVIRRLARRVLSGWGPLLAGLDPDVDADLLLLVVNELVTNAVTHGSDPGDPVVLTLECDRRRLCVGVEDWSSDPPRPRRSGDGDVHGRGLGLVEHVAQTWGHVPSVSRPGKKVWMSVPLDRARSSRAPAGVP